MGKVENYLSKLITATPIKEREQAMKLAGKSIASLQNNGEVRKKLRDEYATDTKQLIASAQLVAIEFQTIAAANNY
jgi:hypothetical protein